MVSEYYEKKFYELAERLVVLAERLVERYDPPMEDPPDTSWVKTQDVKKDFGR